VASLLLAFARERMSIVQAFLLIEQPRQRLGHWSQALAALDSPHAPPLAAIHGYYDATSDQALLELHYEERILGPTQLAFAIDVALRAEVGMIQPNALSDSERARFLGERLARCKLNVTYQRSVVGALVELVRRIKDMRSSLKGGSASRPQPAQAPPTLARGTREDLVTAAAKAVGPQAKAAGPQARSGSQPRAGSQPPPIPTQGRANTEERRLAAIAITKHVVPRSSRARTVEMDPLKASHLLDRSGPRIVPHGRGGVSIEELVADVPAIVDAVGQDTIHARYLRSGKWIPVRVGALSLKGAALITNALPRLHDNVDVSLVFQGHRATVHGVVAKLSSRSETNTTGTTTFSVRFDLDDRERDGLTVLLKAARAAKVTIKPAPARTGRRFPVEWPVCLSSPRGLVHADALDISSAGMFVRPAVPLERNAVLDVSVVLDDGGPAVSGRAKVVRHLGPALAKQCGLAAGFGLALVEMSDVDRARWQLFVSRVERRTEKRVLVGAPPTRLAELQAILAACGYAVTGGTDPGAIVQLANRDAHPADAVLIDATWAASEGTSAALESVFAAKHLPFVTLHGDARSARTALDRLLAVG
jgi:hypothetical protein